MRLPNGYGTVYKLSGNRRRPFVAKVSRDGKQVPIGYYATKEEGLVALAAHNRCPPSVEHVTFAEVYALWSVQHFPRLRSESARVSYRNSYRHAARLHGMVFEQIRLCDLEAVISDVRAAGAGYPTQRKVRTLFSELYAYAVSHDLCVRDYSRYVEIDRPKKQHRKQPFTVRQRNRLWRGVDEMPEARLVLMLIYSGCRIGEFLRIKRADIDLRTRFIRITASKTESGKRLVPIPKRLVPWYADLLNEHKGDYLLCRDDGQPYTYDAFCRDVFRPVMWHFRMKHTPHECRHTLASMLDSADVNRTVIKLILGHSLQGVTERVYTHKTARELLRAIDKVCA